MHFYVVSDSPKSTNPYLNSLTGVSRLHSLYEVKYNDVVITKKNYTDFSSQIAAVSQKKSPHAFTDPGGWASVHIRFINYEKVEIKTSESSYMRTYKSLGFDNKHTRTPKDAWRTLHSMAYHEGNPPLDTKVDKHKVSELQKELKKLFPHVEGNPFKSYRKGHGWRPNFSLTPLDNYPDSSYS